jgi:methionyl-tRNA formyltransferase
VDYIKKKEDFYEEGGDVTYEQLMDWALNEFKARKENGTWCQRSSEEETIIALQAQISQLMKMSRAVPEKPGVEKSQKKDWASKEKVKWIKVALKSGEQTTKEVNGKVWHWCPNHKSWT